MQTFDSNREKTLMSIKMIRLVVALLVGHLFSFITLAEWDPPSEVPREEIVNISEKVLAMPDISMKAEEDIFRIQVAEMDWDVGGMVYQPLDSSQTPVGPNGKKAGIFMLHGGTRDHRFLDPVARFLTGKFGFKVVTMSFPGRIYLHDPSRDWPDDTMKPDGSLRTPIFKEGLVIAKDQYEVVEDQSMRPKYATVILACAKEETEFYHRMAAYPMAFEEAGKAMMGRHFPADEYSIYIHGHSAGGPWAFMFTQRVENISGVVGMETSPFGAIYRIQSRPSGNPYGKTQGELPFNCLKVHNWRVVAMYKGSEARMKEGPKALMRLPMLMEEVHEEWEQVKHFAQFNADNPVHHGGTVQLVKSARAVAIRLKVSSQETEELVEHFVGYVRELRGPNVKPVPPVILGMAEASAGHEHETYRRITLPMFAGMDPPPKVRLVLFRVGTHYYFEREEDLPLGPFPAVAKLWHDAIMNGYYLDNTPGF